jgi:hypothetical protein
MEETMDSELLKVAAEDFDSRQIDCNGYLYVHEDEEKTYRGGFMRVNAGQ